MTDHPPQPATPAAAIPPRAVVAPSGAICRVCGYDLGGLSMHGACPECGAPVVRSLRGNLFEFADVNYLKTLRLGARILFFAIIIFSVFETLAGVYAGLYGALTGFAAQPAIAGIIRPLIDQLPSATTSSFLIFQVLFKSVGAYALLIGWFLLSLRDPGATGSDFDQPARRFLRTMLIIHAVFTTIWLIIQLHPSFINSFVTTTASATQNQSPSRTPGFSWTVFSSGFMIANSIHGLLELIIIIVKFFATLNFMRTLARRIPDESLANLAGAMRWIIPVLQITLLCLGGVLATVIYAVMLDRFQNAICRAIIKSEASARQP